MSVAINRKQSGVSLIIALILIGVISLFAMLVTTIVLSSIRDATNVTRANQAYYAAEGALEQGMLKNLDVGQGYTDTTATNWGCSSDCDSTGATANFKIVGQVVGASGSPADIQYADDQSFGIPTPGTGNAGKYCDPLKPNVKDDFYYSETTSPHYLPPSAFSTTDTGDYNHFTSLDDSCNWGKLYVGQSVDIPLYITVPDANSPGGQKVLNPEDSDFNLKNLEIKLRTPCNSGKTVCGSDIKLDRYWIKHGDPTDIYKGQDPVVNWQISGSDLKDPSKTDLLVPYDYFSSAGVWDKQSSVIYASDFISSPNSTYGNLNIAGNYSVLSGTYSGFGASRKGKDINRNNCYGFLLNFLLNSPRTDSDVNVCDWSGQEINMPVLKLSLIKNIVDSTGDQIPYLEYQIRIKATNTKNNAPANVVQNVVAEGHSGPFKQVLEVKQQPAAGLLEYVIQQ